jgi:hypothetical protein|nr:MAG TPA: hypothetical protein [Bacteriophage sp.]
MELEALTLMKLEESSSNLLLITIKLSLINKLI